MKASETSLQKLMNGASQFRIPIYQRTYSWTIKQCNQLWSDIITIALDKDDEKVHFIGSVVYIDLGVPKGRPEQLLLIDGQQRLTTLSLLLCALGRYIDENNLGDQLKSSKIKNYFLFNNDESGEDRYKLILTEQDKNTFIHLLNATEETLVEPSIRILENYKHFRKIISESNEGVEKIFDGINRLMLVAVALDKTQDNPQLIFESMNSTGKDLTQADLIRNYVLMGLPQEEQNKLYTTYWRPMEQGFGQEGYAEFFDLFMRDFLTSKNSSGRICKIGEVYEAFKKYHKEYKNNEQLLKEVFIYSKYYTAINLGKEKDEQLKILWSHIKTLDVGVSYPFLMNVYNDYVNKEITNEDFITIIKTTISYIVRRVICEIPTNSLNKTFATFYGKIKRDSYVKSVLLEYAIKDSYRAFPTDEEIVEKLIIKDIYHLRIKNYILESLENQNNKEPISITGTGLTIEHIMPQNSNLKKEWKDMLGDNWREIQRIYLHTIGNLTLTGYNSEMSDKPFVEKQNHEKGLKNSHIKLNYDIAKLSKWDESEIVNRSKILAKQVVSIWQYPSISKEDIEEYLEKETVEQDYTSVENYPKMNSEISDIYDELDRKILSLDSGIKKEYKQQYIAYKMDSNFVNIKISKSELTAGLNIPFEEIEDWLGICRNTTNIGNFANNPVLFKINTDITINYVMSLIEQALKYQLEE